MCIRDRHYVFEDGKDRVVILFRCGTLEAESHDLIYDVLCIIQKSIYNTIRLKTTCALGTTAATLDELLSLIHIYSIYSTGEYLFTYFEYEGEDFDADMAKMAADPATQRWWDVVKPLMSPLPDRAEGEFWSDMEEIYHLN